MEEHTLTEEQSKDLGKALEVHISQDIPVGEAGKTLLAKLQRITPNPGQKWAILYTSPEEEEVLQALINSHWGLRKEKPVTGGK